MRNTRPDPVLFVLPSQNFRDEEYNIPRRILEQNHIPTRVASSRNGKLRGSKGDIVETDHTLEEVKPSDFSGVIFVGGSGAKEYWSSDRALQFIQTTSQRKIPLAGICMGAVTLQKAGVLDNHRATCWPAEQSALNQKNITYRGDPVEVDQGIITAAGYHAAERMTNTLLQELQ